MKRLDQWLVDEGFFKTLQESRAQIMAGRVYDKKSGVLLDKIGTPTREGLQVRLRSIKKFVGRGGDKLEGFLDLLEKNFHGWHAIDVGASTGGFTDCLLQRGVAQVWAVDVGKNQLHEKLKKDPRVKSFEETDIRDFDFKKLKKAPELIVGDVSFISLEKIVPVLFKKFPEALFVWLIKPQFEADRKIPKKRGVLPEAERHKTVQEVLLFLKNLGLNVLMVRESSVKGAKGNQEVFVAAQNQIPAHIFRTYDIRGLGERDLHNFTVRRIAQSFGQRVRERSGVGAALGLGCDARLSSPRIRETFISGLREQGVTVVDLGIVPTPMVYFAHYHFPLKSVVQITASHNPKDDNGMKMMLEKETLFGDEIASLYRDCLNERAAFEEKGSLEDRSAELRSAYLEFLKKSFSFKRKYKIVLDCGNGMVGAIARDVFKPIASDLRILYEEVDCRFPNHEADPTIPANLKDLIAEVKKSKADIGFAFDGDGDRLGVITRQGRILWGDEILMLLSELVLKQKPGSTIIGEVKCSEKLFRMVKDRGGKALMYRTGHSLIKKKMKELGAPLAGEMSGHLFFADRYFGFDDATYAALRVLEVMDSLDLSLDEWISQFPESFVTPEIRVDCTEEEKAAAVERVKNYFKKIEGAKQETMDGVRVTLPDGSWALVRASNTQAVLVVRVEGISEKRMIELKKQVSEALGTSLC